MQWAIKGGVSVLDQGVFSGANFVLSILLARWLSVKDYGIYAFASTFVSLFYQVMNALIIEPMSVYGTSDHADNIDQYLSSQRRLYFLLSFAFGFLIISGAIIYQLSGGYFEISVTLILLGLLIAFIQLPWLIRKTFYVISKPRFSLSYSIVYCFLLLSAIFICNHQHWLSIYTSYIIISAASLVSLVSVVAFLRKGSLQFQKEKLSAISKQNWKYGKWMLLTGILMALVGQAPIYLAGLLMTTDASGVVTAIQNLVLPMGMSISAVSSLLIPKFSRDYQEKGLQFIQKEKWAFTGILVFISLIYETLLIFFASPLEKIIYGGKFLSYTYLFPIWGLIPIFMAITAGFSVEIKASKNPKGIFQTAIVWAIATFSTIFFLVDRLGLLGVSICTVFGYFTSAIAYYFVSNNLRKNDKYD